MYLLSSDFIDGEEIPVKFTCQGDGTRPSLNWSDVPAETKTLAITLTDPDAPGEEFVHWAVLNMPSDTISINPGEITGEEIENSSGKTNYFPPCPPSGKHRYIFTLYALDADRIGLSSYEGFLEAVKPHIIDQTTLTGIYQKS